jgi:hypothetical protein
VTSRSVPTLIGLAVIAAALFAVQGALDLIRGRMLVRIGSALHERLRARVFDLVVRLPLVRRSGALGLRSPDTHQPCGERIQVLRIHLRRGRFQSVVGALTAVRSLA